MANLPRHFIWNHAAFAVKLRIVAVRVSCAGLSYMYCTCVRRPEA